MDSHPLLDAIKLKIVGYNDALYQDTVKRVRADLFNLCKKVILDEAIEAVKQRGLDPDRSHFRSAPEPEMLSEGLRFAGKVVTEMVKRGTVSQRFKDRFVGDYRRFMIRNNDQFAIFQREFNGLHTYLHEDYKALVNSLTYLRHAIERGDVPRMVTKSQAVKDVADEMSREFTTLGRLTGIMG
ncbi:unnamed protein product [Linum tenue]|uniref:Uncharacterized protein n=1 Tax=Linum tenue TaxID=586396 RepID=A0AAV0I2H9_9ROSI|nr:unnamed protein product [Linum tenue]CAI0391268.1 unnamed protein product [Linum tenue]